MMAQMMKHVGPPTLARVVAVGASFFVTAKDGVSVGIETSLVFQIMGDPDLGEDSSLVRSFVYELTPAGLEHQLTDVNDQVVRNAVRLIDCSEVHGIQQIRIDLNVDDVDDTIEGVVDQGIPMSLPQIPSDGEDSKHDDNDVASQTTTVTKLVATVLNKKLK